MSAVIHDLQQGTDAWAQFRTVHFGASEAAACLGLSPLMTRSELLHLKHTGISKEHGAWVQEHVLDHGHRVEAAIRSHVESLIGNDLYPVTCSLPGSRLSASCDGLTLEGDTAWENKQWNAELAAQVAAGTVPDSHMPQCQQVLMVTATQRLIFTVTDGTPDKFVSIEVLPDQRWFDRIKRAWDQFERDLAEYVPPERAPVITATPQEHLPAVSVQLNGALAVVSNLEPFGVALRAFVDRIPKKPSTDTEFATCEACCKRLKEAEERLQAAEDSALAGMADVEAMRRMVADFRDLARTTRLASEKLVKQRKEQIREEEVARGRAAFAQHFKALCDRLGGPLIPPMTPDFGAAIKGLKTLDSVRNAIDTTLAQAKIEASALADKIDANMRAMSTGSEGLCGLFPDMKALALKEPDDLAAVIAQRVAQRKASMEAERERVRAEEAARVEREAAAQAAHDRLIAEQKQMTEWLGAQQVLKAEPATADATDRATQPTTSPRVGAMGAGQAADAAPAGKPVHVGVDLAAGPDRHVEYVFDTRLPIKLGDVCYRLGFTITAAFVIDTLGIKPAGIDKRAVLFAAADFDRICDELVKHIKARRDA